MLGRVSVFFLIGIILAVSSGKSVQGIQGGKSNPNPHLTSYLERKLQDKHSIADKLNKQAQSSRSTVVAAAAAAAAATVPAKPIWYMSFFPIYPSELLKFFSLSFMMFWIVFVFTMTR